jgi:hypothetical protein
MKTVTENQKKWAMTACLLAALTFNLSLHIKKDIASSLDLASEIPVKIQDVNAKDGIRNATAYDIGNGEYLVKVPGLTEAGTECLKAECIEQYNVSLTSDEQGKNIENVLAVGTLKKMAGKSKAAHDNDDEDDNEEEVSELTKEDVQKTVDINAQGKFDEEMSDCEDEDNILKNNRCATKSLLLTFSDQDIKKLRDVKEYCKQEGKGKDKDGDDEEKIDRRSRKRNAHKNKREDKNKTCPGQFKPSEDFAVRILHDEIEEQLGQIVTDEPDLTNIPPYEANRLREIYKQRMLDGIENLKSLQSKVPKGFNAFRNELAAMVAKMQAIKNKKFAETLLTLARNKNPNNYQQTADAAKATQYDMNEATNALNGVIDPTCTGSLGSLNSTCVAIRDGYIDQRDAAGIYTSNYGSQYFDNTVKMISGSVITTPDRIINGQYVSGRVIIQPNAINGQSRQVVSGNETADFVNRQNGDARSNGGRISGPGVVQTQSAPRGIVYNGQVYQAVEDVTSPDVMPATPVTTSSAVTFGPEQALSPENQALRAQLRKQYPRP